MTKNMYGYAIKLSMILIFMACYANNTMAQDKGDIKGTVVDSASKQPVVSATITIFLKGGAVLSKVVTDAQGAFELKQLPMDSLLLRVSYVGVASYNTRLLLKTSKLDVGIIPLNTKVELQTVKVVAAATAVKMKHDTIEYNAASFRTGQGAVIEDLIKKLPGLQVSADGSITYNGKNVSKIMVNGREFFGSDPKIALQSLPADIVSKIQLMDTKTPDQAITGRPSDGENKTLNIKLKKDIKDVVNITGGLGSDSRYEASGIYSRFEDDRQIGVVGSANNINKIGFSSGLPGDALSVIDAGNGITTSKLAGVNYSDNWRKDLKVTGNYNYSDAFTDNSSTRQQQQFLVPDSSFYTANQTHSTNGTQTHHAELKFEYNPDLKTSVFLNPTLTQSNTQSDNSSKQQTTNSAGDMLNSSIGEQHSTGSYTLYGATFFLVKGFKKPGRSLSVNINPNGSLTRQDNQNNTKSIFYLPGRSDSLLNVNQRQVTSTNVYEFSSSVSYTEPVFKKVSVVLSEGIRRQKSDVSRKIFQTDTTGNNPVFDNALSSIYSSTGFTSNSGLEFAYYSPKVNITVGAKAINYTLNTQVQGLPGTFNNNGLSVVPSANISLVPGKYQNLGINLSSYIVQPQSKQLLPVVDNTNPLFIITGNPNLKASLFSNYSLNYSIINPKGWMGFFTFNYSPMQRDIISSVQYQPNGSQESTFINVNGDNRTALYLFIKRTWTNGDVQKSLNISLNAGQNHQASYINGIQSTANSLTYTPAITAALNNNIIDVGETYSPSFTRLTNSSPAIPKQLFNVQTLKTDLRLTWPKVVEWDNTVSYNYNTQAPAGFKKGSLLWNTNISKSLFKGAGLMRFTVYDLLKQNNNVSRVATVNSIEDTESTVLQQYFMLSFNYKFSGK